MKALHLLVSGSLLSATGMIPGAETGVEAGRRPAVSGWVMAAPAGSRPAGATSQLENRRSSSAIPSMAPLATVMGTVKDEAGAPLIGAIVALLEPHARGKELQSVRTDGSGKFTATIAPGAYRLRATATGFSSLLTRIQLDRSGRVTYDFALKRTDTLVFKRGDSQDYRWIARSVPRQILNLLPGGGENRVDPELDQLTARRATFHGMAQFLTTPGGGRSRESLLPGQSFYGANFAVAGSIDGRIEMALIGQRGFGGIAPQRLTAIASMRTPGQQEVTASVSYGQISLRPPFQEGRQRGVVGETLDQLSITSSSSLQLTDSLVVIYGLDYASFIGTQAREHESLLPNVGVQYQPHRRWRLHGGITPGRQRSRLSLESFRGEAIERSLELAVPEIAFVDHRPLIDHSRRYELGIEHLFDGAEGGIATTLFYDRIDGHGIGLAPLSAPESHLTLATGSQVRALYGVARGGRVLLRRSLSDHVTATFGYSLGSGRHLRSRTEAVAAPVGPFQDQLFQLATGQVDIDLTSETGTRISAVYRLSPTPFLFAIDPFAGQMGIYDPNLNIYLTQELPTLGLPIQWQAILDLRNLLNQTPTVEEGGALLLATRTSRIIRGGVAFRW
jgi:hypothetical protein